MDVKPHKLNSSDYRAVASLHCDHINQGFLATLGVPFLTLLYEAIDKDSESVLLVERVDRSVVGFVTGTRGLGRIYKQLLLKPLRLIYSLKSCLLSPSKMYKIIEVLLISKDSNISSDLPKQELLSIVVNPAYQGGGHAENLFNALCFTSEKRVQVVLALLSGVIWIGLMLFIRRWGLFLLKKSKYIKALILWFM